MFRTIALVVIVITPMQALAAGSCMTKSEARRVYSTAHLYWHGADHCWDATPGRRRYAEKRRHHFVRQHRDARDEEEVAQAEPQPVVQAQAEPQPAPAMRAQPQQAEEPTPSPALMPPTLTADNLVRAGHTMKMEELESKLRNRWPDTHMEFRTKPLLIESAAADAEPTMSVGIVMLSIGGVLVICTVLVAFGATVEQRRQRRDAH